MHFLRACDNISVYEKNVQNKVFILIAADERQSGLPWQAGIQFALLLIIFYERWIIRQIFLFYVQRSFYFAGKEAGAQ